MYVVKSYIQIIINKKLPLIKFRNYIFIIQRLFLFSGICMSIGILCFPAGWDNDHVRGICGASAADYVLGDCGIR